MNLSVNCPINPTGYGIASLNIVKALYKNNINLSLFPISQPYVNNQIDYTIVASLLSNGLDHFDPKAPCLKIWHQFDLINRIGNGPYVAFPFFELDTFNDLEKKHLSVPDCILATSNWAKQIISNHIKTVVHIIPLGVDTEIFNPSLYQNSSSNNKYVFLNIGKWEIRKGHDILLELFNNAFPSETDVELWILASENNSYSSPEELSKWKKMYSSPRIKIFTGVESHRELAKLISESDCGLYPSRAEGWNLELLETMAMGKPVITTNYSAHTEFCNQDNSYLIDISDTEPAHDGKAFKGQGNWAKITSKEKDKIIDQMRYVYKNRINHNINGIKTAQIYTWQNTCEALCRCINL